VGALGQELWQFCLRAHRADVPPGSGGAVGETPDGVAPSRVGRNGAVAGPRSPGYARAMATDAITAISPPGDPSRHLRSSLSRPASPVSPRRRRIPVGLPRVRRPTALGDPGADAPHRRSRAFRGTLEPAATARSRSAARRHAARGAELIANGQAAHRVSGTISSSTSTSPRRTSRPERASASRGGRRGHSETPQWLRQVQGTLRADALRFVQAPATRDQKLPRHLLEGRRARGSGHRRYDRGAVRGIARMSDAIVSDRTRADPAVARVSSAHR
jgi:hypothetical protein